MSRPWRNQDRRSRANWPTSSKNFLADSSKTLHKTKSSQCRRILARISSAVLTAIDLFAATTKPSEVFQASCALTKTIYKPLARSTTPRNGPMVKPRRTSNSEKFQQTVELLHVVLLPSQFSSHRRTLSSSYSPSEPLFYPLLTITLGTHWPSVADLSLPSFSATNTLLLPMTTLTATVDVVHRQFLWTQHSAPTNR